MKMSWVVKRDPFNELNDFGRLVASTLPRLFNGEEELSGNWSPRVDISEEQNSIVLEADLPGMKPEEFKLSIENFKLTLSGERKFEKEARNGNWHRVERGYGSFARTFALPNTVNVEGVKAEFRDGVLRVTLPKREEVKARQIEVKIGDAGKAATN
jgi:HSP20 family protein